MPGLDGTGPRGTGQNTGRGCRGCRSGPAHPDVVPSPVQAPNGANPAGEQQDQPYAPLLGAGRSGIPCGCKRGHIFGGGRSNHRV